MSITVNGKSYICGRDAVNPDNIPVDGTDVAMGYINGPESEWPANGWDRFPNAVKFAIDVLGTRPDADMLDVEPGDVLPTSTTLIAWVDSGYTLFKAGKKRWLPIVYLNGSELTPAYNNLLSRGYKAGEHFLLGMATLDGTITTPSGDLTGVWGVQFEDEGGYDNWVVFAPLPSGTNPAPAPSPVPTSGQGTYTVAEGDTLWGIASKVYGSGTKWETIYQANEGVIGSNPDEIKPGEVLTLPGVASSQKTYTVVGGDTLWGISVKVYGTGVKWETIYTANRGVIGDDPDVIRAGEVLVIP